MLVYISAVWDEAREPCFLKRLFGLDIRAPGYDVLTPTAADPSLCSGKRKLTEATFFAALERLR